MTFPTSADITSLCADIQRFSQLLEDSGVGALPLLDTDPEGMSGPRQLLVKDGQTLLKETSTAVNLLYARKKQLEENNGIVAGLLGATSVPATTGLSSSQSSSYGTVLSQPTMTSVREREGSDERR